MSNQSPLDLNVPSHPLPAHIATLPNTLTARSVSATTLFSPPKAILRKIAMDGCAAVRISASDSVESSDYGAEEPPSTFLGV